MNLSVVLALSLVFVLVGCKFFAIAFVQPDCTNVAGWNFYWNAPSQPTTLASQMPIAPMGGCDPAVTKKNAVVMNCVTGERLTTWLTAYNAAGAESTASPTVGLTCP